MSQIRPAAIKTGLDFGRWMDSSAITNAYAMTKAAMARKPAVWFVKSITLPVVSAANASPGMSARISTRAMYCMLDYILSSIDR